MGLPNFTKREQVLRESAKFETLTVDRSPPPPLIPPTFFFQKSFITPALYESNLLAEASLSLSGLKNVFTFSTGRELDR